MMNFLKPKHESKEPSSQNQGFPQCEPLNHALNSLQTHLSNILRIPLPHFSIPNPFSSSTTKIPSRFEYVQKKNLGLSAAEIKKRLLGIPVYKVCSYEADVCSLVSDVSDTKFQFIFLSKPDAEDYLQNFWLGTDYQIFDTPLTDVVDYEQKGHPIRLVPELSQVNNAIEERKKHIEGFPDETFSGVPVFQSDKLIIKFDQKPSDYRPAFLRKEDLEKTLTTLLGPKHASSSTIQVAALEDIIQEMKDCSTSKWNDVIVVGPGITSWKWFPRD